MKIPKQKFFVGQLVIASDDHYWYFKKGEVGWITLARCDEVCCKGGDTALPPGDGGPEYTMEWCYVALFDYTNTPQGVRLDGLSPVEVLQ